jgi:hypothetical protein
MNIITLHIIDCSSIRYWSTSIWNTIVVSRKFAINDLMNRTNEVRFYVQRVSLLFAKVNQPYVQFITTIQNIHQIPIGRHSL